jgi:DNA-binding NtrC family response regulator
MPDGGGSSMKRILFVDDESRILDGIRRMMRTERERWEMEFALGGEAALLAFDSGNFDVVVSDMRMPGMDGATLLTHIRDRSPASVRIILSGHTELEAAIRAIPVAHRFLAKPCDAVALRETLERACTLQDLLSRAEIRRVVSTIGELPSLSATVATVLKAS